MKSRRPNSVPRSSHLSHSRQHTLSSHTAKYLNSQFTFSSQLYLSTFFILRSPHYASYTNVTFKTNQSPTSDVTSTTYILLLFLLNSTRFLQLTLFIPRFLFGQLHKHSCNSVCFLQKHKHNFRLPFAQTKKYNSPKHRKCMPLFFRPLFSPFFLPLRTPNVVSKQSSSDRPIFILPIPQTTCHQTMNYNLIFSL